MLFILWISPKFYGVFKVCAGTDTIINRSVVTKWCNISSKPPAVNVQGGLIVVKGTNSRTFIILDSHPHTTLSQSSPLTARTSSGWPWRTRWARWGWPGWGRQRTSADRRAPPSCPAGICSGRRPRTASAGLTVGRWRCIQCRRNLSRPGTEGSQNWQNWIR